MNKTEFLAALKGRLDGLSPDDIKKSLDFYEEVIDDRVEEGFTEEQTVEEIGSPIDVADKIIAEMPITTVIKSKIKNRGKLSGWMAMLLAILSPVIFSLFLAFSITYITVIAVIWSLFITLIGIVIGFIVGGIGGAVVSVVQAVAGVSPSFLFTLSASLILIGLGLLLVLSVKGTYKGTVFLTKKTATFIKTLIVK